MPSVHLRLQPVPSKLPKRHLPVVSKFTTPIISTVSALPMCMRWAVLLKLLSHGHPYTDSADRRGPERLDTSHLQARSCVELLSLGKANNPCESTSSWAPACAKTLSWLPVNLKCDESKLTPACRRLIFKSLENGMLTETFSMYFECSGHNKNWGICQTAL